ncbi:MAG: hypothetical protein ACREN2_12460 [Candidatus Dormibacteria bacterium]
MDFWAGIIGAAVGGLATLAATWLTGHQGRKAAAKAGNDLTAATALMMQDDFYHRQAALARALDRRDWWDAHEMLKQQTSVDDRKVVWAALKDKPITAAVAPCDCLTYLDAHADGSQPAHPSVTNAVADAQGWMDYLIQRRELAADGHATGPDIDLMRRTFALLDVGRRALQELARRPATDFSQSRLFGEGGLKTCRSVRDLLNGSHS